MSPSVAAALRRLVAERAGYMCEYCGIPESLTFFGCQIDHIVAAKHGGDTTANNLCYACVFCNRFKGSDLGSVDPDSGALVRFFNPRSDCWGSILNTSALASRRSQRLGLQPPASCVSTTLIESLNATRVTCEGPVKLGCTG
jgi:Restriction endonuclease